MSYWKDWPLLNFISDAATAAVRELVGERDLRHALVVPPLGPPEAGPVCAYAADHGVELLQWLELLTEMAGLVRVRKNARNPTDYLLRVFASTAYSTCRTSLALGRP